MPLDSATLCRLLIAVVGTSWAPDAMALQSNSNAPNPTITASGQPPLRSRAALDAYLSTGADPNSPLERLPPLARRRFLESLVFGEKGVGGFELDDLATELTPDEILRVLSLFDVEAYASIVHSRNANQPKRSRRDPPPVPGRVEAGFDVLHGIAQRGDRAALTSRFEAMLADLLGNPEDIKRLGARELVYLLRSVALVSSDAPESGYGRYLRNVVDELDRRGLAQDSDFEKVHDALLLSRRFEEAKRYAESHPQGGFVAFPRIVDALGDAPGAPSVWRMDEEGTTLTRATLDLVPVQILVTAGCHFSQDAAEDILGDPVLGPVFTAHAHWLVLPPGQEDMDAVRAWNKRFPAAQAMPIHDRKEWTLLPSNWPMPTFLIVRNGEVIERITGWPRNPRANRQPLIEALIRAGLIPAKPGRHK